MEQTIALLRADGSAEALPSKLSLQDLQFYVGGYIEIVRPSNAPSTDWYFITNEEGLLMGLDFNRMASAIAEMTLVGDVILTNVPLDTLCQA
jgi:hypothetical protein